MVNLNVFLAKFRQLPLNRPFLREGKAVASEKKQNNDVQSINPLLVHHRSSTKKLYREIWSEGTRGEMTGEREQKQNRQKPVRND